jgi:hypothetical protein
MYIFLVLESACLFSVLSELICTGERSHAYCTAPSFESTVLQNELQEIKQDLKFRFTKKQIQVKASDHILETFDSS